MTDGDPSRVLVCAVGDLVEDVVAVLDGSPVHGSDVGAQITRHRGGSAANVAVHAAAVAGRSRFVGAVGADRLGDRLLAALRAAGVDPVVVRRGRTGSIVVLVTPDGERTMITDRGAATDLSDPRRSWIAAADVLHVPAYSLIGGALAATSYRLVGWAHDAGMLVSIDASSSGPLATFGVDRFLAVVADLRPDVLFASAGEAATLGLDGRRRPDGVGTLVLRRGGDPTTTVSADGTTTTPVPPATVVDTTGAGDAFAAAFLVAAAGGATMVDAVAAGHRRAAVVIGVAGAGGAGDGPTAPTGSGRRGPPGPVDEERT